MPETLPEAELVHSLPGRTRLRFAQGRHDGAFLASIATALSAIRGVIRVELRPSTGSVLIRHNIPLEQVGSAAQARNLFTINPNRPEPAAPNSTWDRKSTIAAVMCGLALWQVARGRVLPPAVTLAMYAADYIGLLKEDQSAANDADMKKL